jgi:hypothetical protein
MPCHRHPLKKNCVLYCTIRGSHSDSNCYVFWDITQCSPLRANGHFDGIYRLYFQSRRINQARNQREAGSKQSYYREHGADMFLRNVGWLSTDYTMLHPRRQNSSYITLLTPLSERSESCVCLTIRRPACVTECLVKVTCTWGSRNLKETTSGAFH